MNVFYININMKYEKSSISKYEHTVNGGSAFPLTEFITSASHNFERGTNDTAIYGGGHKDPFDRMKKYSIPMSLVYNSQKGGSYKSKSESTGVIGEDLFDKLFSSVQGK